MMMGTMAHGALVAHQMAIMAHQLGRHLSQVHQAGMEVPGHGPLGARRSSTQSRHLDLLDLCLLEALGLCPSVLEPDLHLRLRQPERRGELSPLGDAQVLLLPELLLQREQLLCGEGSAGLPVGFVLPQVAFDPWRFVGIWKIDRISLD